MSPFATFVLLVGLVHPLVAGFAYDEDYLVPPSCTPCEAKSCPELKYCAGKVLKDECGCCSRCSSKLFQPHTSPKEPVPEEVLPTTQEVNPCEARQCPKFKVCMVNQQGIPICRCPSLFVCKTKGHGRSGSDGDLRICGTDGITYESRCHLRIASCQNSKRIKRKHKGPCLESDVPASDGNQLMTVQDDDKSVDIFGSTGDESELLQRVEKARRKKMKRRNKKNRKMNRNERKALKERKRLERRNRQRQKRRRRMKRRNRNGSYSVYSDQYGYLLGRHTNWSKSQVRKSKI